MRRDVKVRAIAILMVLAFVFVSSALGETSVRKAYARKLVGTYIGNIPVPPTARKAGMPKEIKYKLEIKKDNIAVRGPLYEWNITEIGKFLPPRVIMSPLCPKILERSQLRADILGDTLKDCQTYDTFTKAPGAHVITTLTWYKRLPLAGAGGSYYTKIQKSRLWSKYKGRQPEGQMIIEFKRDHNGFMGFVERWDLRGDILTFRIDADGEKHQLHARSLSDLSSRIS